MADGVKINISSETSDAKKGFKQVQTQAQKTAKKIQSGFEAAQGGVIGFVKHLAAAHPVLTAIGAGVGLITAGMVKAVNWAKNLAGKYDGIAKAAKSLNMDPMRYQALLYAGNISGVEEQKMTNLLNVLIARQAEAVNGSVLMVDAFEKLGITIKELRSMKPAELITQIARNLKEDSDSEYGLTKIFGIKQAGNVRKLAKEDIGFHQAEFYVRYGIPPEALSAAEKFSDEMYRFSKAIETTEASLNTYLGLHDKLTNMYKRLGDIIKKDGALPADLAEHYETRTQVATQVAVQNADASKLFQEYRKNRKYVTKASKSKDLGSAADPAPIQMVYQTFAQYIRRNLSNKNSLAYDKRFLDQSQDVVAKLSIKNQAIKTQNVDEKARLWKEHFDEKKASLKKADKFITEYVQEAYEFLKDLKKNSKNKNMIEAAEAIQNFSFEYMQMWPAENPDDLLQKLQQAGLFDQIKKQTQVEIAKYKGNSVGVGIVQNAKKLADAKFDKFLQTIDVLIEQAKKEGNAEKVNFLTKQKSYNEGEKAKFTIAFALKQLELQSKISEAAVDAELRKIEDEEKIKTGGMDARRQIAYRQWQEQYGVITDTIKSKIDKILQHEINKSMPTYQTQILSNQLARRGGFTSSVVETLDPNRAFQNKVTSVLTNIQKNVKISADNSILR